MTNCARSREKWRREFEAALAPLADSVTGRGYGADQTFGNADYRILVKTAQSDERVSAVLDNILTDINADPIEAIDLLKSHPSVGEIFKGNGADARTIAIMPGSAFTLRFRDLAKQAAVLAISRDESSAAADIDEFLFESTGGRLPGIEVAVIQGVATSGVIDLGPGTRLTSYGEAIKLGLCRKDRETPFRHGPDYQEREASVLFREFTWSPCLIAPKDHKHTLNPDGKVGLENVEPNYLWDKGPPLWVLLDILSLAAEQGIDLLSMSTNAPQLVEIDPQFGPGGATSWNHEKREIKQLTTTQVELARKLFELWSEFDGEEKWRIELSLARLVSAVRRGRDRFWVEDRIFDVAVSLEVMFRLGVGEITHKLATRCAWLMEKDGIRRVATFEDVQELYKLRSMIIHGSGTRKISSREYRDKVKRVAERGFELAREVLIAILKRGEFPDWKRLSLGAE